MKKMEITTRTFAMTAAIGSILIIATLILNTIWTSKQTVSATEEAVSSVSSFYLEAMADRRAKTITNLISNNFDQMEKALIIFEDERIETQDDLRDLIGKTKSLLSLSRFALVDEDNIVYTQYTTYTGGSRHEFLSKEVMDEHVISTVYLYGSSKQLCLAFQTPGLKVMGKPFKACFVQIDIKDIVDLLAFDDEGRTHFAIYSKNGGNLSDTDLGPVIGEKNILNVTKGIVPDDEWERFRDDFANEAAGNLMLSSAEGGAETLSYVPIEGTGWEMVVLIRESVIQDQIQAVSEKNLMFSRYQILFALIAMIVFAGVLLLQLRAISRNRLEAERENSRTFRSMANTDSMTGDRNKHAYSEFEIFTNLRIRENEVANLAVIICDINGLKYVNDTLGHAAGDKLIKDASAMICECFTHGSVFRIGGDEFAVILQGKGYDTREKDIEDFNRRVEENLKNGGVVISLGHSALTKDDDQLRDVFERADQMMYERKKELKAMGAKTRD